MSKQLTIRGVSDELGRRLARLSRGSGRSINATALQLLERGLGLDTRRRHLERYATWTDADVAEFDRALADQRVLDDELWG
jgi:predicted transcriptional regulator